MNVHDVAEVIRAHRFRYANEAELQASVAALFDDARREVRLGGAGVIDVLVGDSVGIECKVDGSAAAVIRQVNRYARARPDLDGIVLVTNRVRHRSVATAVTVVPVVVVFAGTGVAA